MSWEVVPAPVLSRFTDARPFMPLDRLSFLEMGERVKEHVFMVRDRADGSHIIMEYLLLAGNDRKAKAPTARAFIIIGRHPGLKHSGDFRVSEASLMKHTPVCALEVRAEFSGKLPAGTRHGRMGAYHAISAHVWSLVSRSRWAGRCFWLASLGKRRMRYSQEGMIKNVRYYGAVDAWRVPRDKFGAFTENKRRMAVLKKKSSWVFENVESAHGGAA